MIETTVRCFRRAAPDESRCGVWLMTGPHRGIFFHGQKQETETPEWSLESLDEHARGVGDMADIEEVTADEAVEELSSWPGAQIQARKIFARHPLGY